MTAAAAKAMVDLLGHVQEARARKRVRCNSRTTWSHDNLSEYVQCSLPSGWRVFGPGAPAPGPEPPPAPTQYPPQGGVEELRDFFIQAGVAPDSVAALDLCVAQRGTHHPCHRL